MTTTSAPPSAPPARRGLAQYLPPPPSDAPIPLDHPAVRAVAALVWPSVSKGPEGPGRTPDAVCWTWTGKAAARSCLLSIHGEQVHVARLVWELSGLASLRGHFLEPSCGYGSTCLNPAHRRPRAYGVKSSKGRSLWQILGLDVTPATPSGAIAQADAQRFALLAVPGVAVIAFPAGPQVLTPWGQFLGATPEEAMDRAAKARRGAA